MSIKISTNTKNSCSSSSLCLFHQLIISVKTICEIKKKASEAIVKAFYSQCLHMCPETVLTVLDETCDPVMWNQRQSSLAQKYLMMSHCQLSTSSWNWRMPAATIGKNAKKKMNKLESLFTPIKPIKLRRQLYQKNTVPLLQVVDQQSNAAPGGGVRVKSKLCPQMMHWAQTKMSF